MQWVWQRAQCLKLWLEVHVKAKGIASHHQSVPVTGGGRGTPELSPPKMRMASILAETSVSGIVLEKGGDTYMAQTPDDPGKGSNGSNFYWMNNVQVQWLVS